ncbi:unnamed protein product [Clavelina lepadiformis]|uniref:Soluble interferon alpha/beta receptor OPG204 n=1 Tax=Clavelina lepadiformis TaxID=159417 RepID=A0ABP0FWC4_CLALP
MKYYILTVCSLVFFRTNWTTSKQSTDSSPHLLLSASTSDLKQPGTDPVKEEEFSGSSEPDYDECNHEDLNITVPKNWPAELLCHDRFNFYEEYDSFSFQCKIFDTNSQLLHEYSATYDYYYYSVTESTSNGTFHIEGITEPSYYRLQLTKEDGSKCEAKIIRLIPVDVENQTHCGDALKSALQNLQHEKIEVQCNRKRQELLCKLPKNIPEVLRSDGYDVTWYRDCDPLPNDMYKNTDYGFSLLELLAQDILPGYYSCRITYRGASIFGTHYQLVSQDTLSGSISLQWEPAFNSKQGRTGENVTLECTGVVSDPQITISWKQNKIFQLCDLRYPWRKTNNRCSVSRSEELLTEMNNTDGCNFYKYRYSTTLTIENFQPEDATSYQCIVYPGRESSEKQATIIVENVDDDEKSDDIILIGLAVILFVVLLCGVVMKCFSTELKLVAKKYMASYEKDHRSYTAFLSYSFNKEKDDEGLKPFINDLLLWCEQRMYRVYDERTSDVGGLHYSKISKIISDCYRIIIVLTPCYIKPGTDNRHHFAAQMSIVSNIEDKTQSVFVLLPTVKKQLRDGRAAGDQTCNSLLTAMELKRNTVIEWKGTKGKCRFYKELEVAMPKLKPQKEYSNEAFDSCA